MKKMWRWYQRLSSQIRDSVKFSLTIIGGASTFCTVVGISLSNIPKVSIWARIGLVVLFAIVIAKLYYYIVGKVYKDAVTLMAAQTPVEINCGDIFEVPGVKVIGCDNHFDTRVDDVVISKKSLHGKLVLEHGDVNEINEVVEKAAHKIGLEKNAEGFYDFPLGTIIRYVSSVDEQTYLLLAMTELNEEYEAHTSMAKYEQMLMKMWKEIDRVYASYDVVLPVLGAGIARFDDRPKSKDSLLRCMLCTFYNSGVILNSKVKIVIYGDAKDIPLYEYKSIFNRF